MSENYWLVMMVVCFVLAGLNGRNLGMLWSLREMSGGFDRGDRVVVGVSIVLGVVCVAGAAVCAAQLA